MRQDFGSRLPAPRPRPLIPEPKVKVTGGGGGEGSPPPRPHRRIREGEENLEEKPKSGDSNKNWTGNWSNPLDRMNDERGKRFKNDNYCCCLSDRAWRSCKFSMIGFIQLRQSIIIIESSPTVEKWHDDREGSASHSKWTHDLFDKPKGKPRKLNAVQGGR